MKSWTQRYPIGIDIGHCHVYAAQLQSRHKETVVRKLFHRAVDGQPTSQAEDDAHLVAALAEVRKNGHFRGRRAVVSLPTGELLNMPIRVTIRPGDDLETAIAAEAEQHLPYPLSEAVIDYPSLFRVSGDQSRQYRVTVVSLHRDTLARYESLLEQAGLVLEAVDFNVSALHRLHPWCSVVPDNALMTVRVGDTHSSLSVVSTDEILGHRNIKWGVRALSDKLVVNLRHLKGADNARILMQQYGLAEIRREPDAAAESTAAVREHNRAARAISQVILPLVEELVYECHKVFSYVRSEVPGMSIEKLCLFGAAGQVNGLADYLSRRLGMPAALIDPLAKGALRANGSSPENAAGSQYALALGLATRRVPWP